MTEANPRTTIADAVLEDVSAGLGESEVDALLDVSLTATEQAALSYDNLLDADEYVEVRL